MVRLPERDAAPGLGATVKITVLLPALAFPEITASHEELLTAVTVQPARAARTTAEPLPPAAEKVWLDCGSDQVQGAFVVGTARPILLANCSPNQRPPSGPAAMPTGPLPGVLMLPS